MTESNDIIPAPYALWLGPATDLLTIKIATGLLQWRPEAVRCVILNEGTRVSPILTDDGITPLLLGKYTDNYLVVAQLLSMGIRTIVNCYNAAGPLHRDMLDLFDVAMKRGMHVASGSHARLLGALPSYRDPDRVHDFRHGQRDYPLGTGRKRTGLRLLTVGPDGAMGKKFTALRITRELRKYTKAVTFCATGQTGRLLCEPEDRWIVMDTVPSDFATGAAEWLSPDHQDAGHWYVVEGQANAWHAAWGPPSLAVLQGSQPDALVYCAIPGRKKQRSSGMDMPDMYRDIERHLHLCKNLGFDTRLAAISVNRSECTPKEYEEWLRYLTNHQGINPWLNVPVFDPSEDRRTDGLDALVDSLSNQSDRVRPHAAD